MTTPTLAAPTREETATRLLRGSAEHSYDPLTEIDWDAPIVPGAYWQPPERSSLYGTELWDRLTEEQRVELTKHEMASIASVGVWFELILMQMLVRDLYNRDPRTAHVQYGLTEIADECRHSVMFGRAIEKMGCPAYGPGRLAHLLGRYFKASSRGPLSFASALYVEEILDVRQREVMRDESLQPLAREVSRIHVVEEARHMRYARDEVARKFDELSTLDKAHTRLVFAVVVAIATRRLIHPDVYAAVGLDPREAARVARRNPHWRATQVWAAARATAFCREVGLIAGPSALIWRRLGLLG
ncbi:MAG: hypothetical protein QOG53_332 [Frankiales bacterium]|jgi:hypothetical protein|nr:hypothetical protein [Frankiales bacterium]